MKKKIIISLAVILVLVLLFFPVYKGSYDDGGTRVYDALTYKLVAWNRLYVTIAEDHQTAESTTYKKTSIYWFPNNLKSIDELWKTELSNNSKGNQETLPTEAVRDTIPNLTMATLISLVNICGEDLTWEDFGPYWCVDIGSGLYVLRYPINDTYFLRISGADTTQPPMNIHLVAEQDPDIFIDVRTESIEDFIADGRAAELAAKAKEQALNVAKMHYDSDYDYTNILYNIDDQQWYVEFWQNDAKRAAQVIILDKNGTVTEILYKE